jgi:hypothetical protein
LPRETARKKVGRIQEGMAFWLRQEGSMRIVKRWRGKKFAYQSGVRRHPLFAAWNYWPARFRGVKAKEAVEAIRHIMRHCLDIDA